MFSLIYFWTNGWAKTRDAGGLKRHRAHYDFTVIMKLISSTMCLHIPSYFIEWRISSEIMIKGYHTLNVCWHIYSPLNCVITGSSVKIPRLYGPKLLHQPVLTCWEFTFFLQQNGIENILCKIWAILFWSRCIKGRQKYRFGNHLCDLEPHWEFLEPPVPATCVKHILSNLCRAETLHFNRFYKFHLSFTLHLQV